jgi:hypothetical protein
MVENDMNTMKTKMTGVSKMILDGRYQESRYSGNMIGHPFEGISTTGYNNASKQIESTWVDNMGTGIMNLKGDYDDTSKVMKLKGEVGDQMTGKLKPVRETLAIVDDNTTRMQMFDDDAEGKEYKSMKIVMIRKK